MGELSIERDEVFRIKTARRPGMLAKVLAAAGEYGANIGEIETVYIGADYNIREVAIIAPDAQAIDRIAAAMDAIEGVSVLPGHIDKVFDQHRGGKIEIRSRATSARCTPPVLQEWSRRSSMTRPLPTTTHGGDGRSRS